MSNSASNLVATSMPSLILQEELETNAELPDKSAKSLDYRKPALKGSDLARSSSFDNQERFSAPLPPVKSKGNPSFWSKLRPRSASASNAVSNSKQLSPRKRIVSCQEPPRSSEISIVVDEYQDPPPSGQKSRKIQKHDCRSESDSSSIVPDLPSSASATLNMPLATQYFPSLSSIASPESALSLIDDIPTTLPPPLLPLQAKSHGEESVEQTVTACHANYRLSSLERKNMLETSIAFAIEEEEEDEDDIWLKEEEEEGVEEQEPDEKDNLM